jgi:hypothetical protein
VITEGLFVLLLLVVIGLFYRQVDVLTNGCVYVIHVFRYGRCIVMKKFATARKRYSNSTMDRVTPPNEKQRSMGGDRFDAIEVCTYVSCPQMRFI